MTHDLVAAPASFEDDTPRDRSAEDSRQLADFVQVLATSTSAEEVRRSFVALSADPENFADDPASAELNQAMVRGDRVSIAALAAEQYVRRRARDGKPAPYTQAANDLARFGDKLAYAGLTYTKARTVSTLWTRLAILSQQPGRLSPQESGYMFRTLAGLRSEAYERNLRLTGKVLLVGGMALIAQRLART